MENKKFSYVDSTGLSHEVDLSAQDFELVQRDAVITDQKIQSKPTTFFKDAIRRFRKNKSSVAAAVILGILISFAIVLPIAMPFDVDNPHPYERLLAPKLFDAGTGWWDGGQEYKDVVLDIDWDQYDATGEIIGKPANHEMRLVMGGQKGIKYNPMTYSNAVNAYAHEGYARISGAFRTAQADSFTAHSTDEDADLLFLKDNTYTFTIGENTESGTWTYENSTLTLTDPTDETTTVSGTSLIFTYRLSSDQLITADFNIAASDIVSLLPIAQPQMNSWNGVPFDFTDDSHNYVIEIESADPEVGELSSYWNFGARVSFDVNFEWVDLFGMNTYSVPLATNVNETGKLTLNLNDKLAEIQALIDTDPVQAGHYALSAANKPHLSIALNMVDKGADTNNAIIKKVIFSSDIEAEQEALEGLSMYDANTALSIPRVNDKGEPQKYYWTSLNGNVNLFHAKMVRGSFRIDTYEEKLGLKAYNPTIQELRDWKEKGWADADFTIYDQIPSLSGDALAEAVRAFAASIRVTNAQYCPLVIDELHPVVGSKQEGGGLKSIKLDAYVTFWKILYPGTNAMPRYLFGTDDYGKDMLKSVFSGLRTSLLLGVLTFIVNFSIGLIYGACAGYFGGWTDILMERFTDILGGVPWIVVMTLCIINMGNNFWVFALALCMTGWIGTSSTTRTQFYRFKNREYILAARTLGASDGRLIFRHILPNAIGTIVTSSVLMIPGVIFSEATLAYLNLGLQGMSSFGVILSENQKQINTYPHLILFPSAIMALIMISFNLFGNGLRDAFNPSLKGGE